LTNKKIAKHEHNIVVGKSIKNGVFWVVTPSVGSIHNTHHKDLIIVYRCKHLVPKMPTPEHKGKQ
jgi:hypothetical protein